jgi:hypothetical protein
MCYTLQNGRKFLGFCSHILHASARTLLHTALNPCSAMSYSIAIALAKLC